VTVQQKREDMKKAQELLNKREEQMQMKAKNAASISFDCSRHTVTRPTRSSPSTNSICASLAPQDPSLFEPARQKQLEEEAERERALARELEEIEREKERERDYEIAREEEEREMAEAKRKEAKGTLKRFQAAARKIMANKQEKSMVYRLNFVCFSCLLSSLISCELHVVFH
jgi:type IV secretory pathway VirB4 component